MLALVFGAIVALKLALLAIYGPLFTPDSGGYIGYAEAIRTSRAWMSDAGLTQAAAPIFAIRMIGYPAFIVAAMTLAGGGWAYVVVVAQFVLSLYVGCRLYRLTIELGFAPLVALLATAAYLLSLPLTYDQTILTDSLYTSIIVLAIVTLITTVLSGADYIYAFTRRAWTAPAKAS